MKICLIVLFYLSIAQADSEVFGKKHIPLKMNNADVISATLKFPSMASFNNEHYLLSLIQLSADISIISYVGYSLAHYKEDLWAPWSVPIGLGLLTLHRLGAIPINLISNKMAQKSFVPLPLLSNRWDHRGRLSVGLQQTMEQPGIRVGYEWGRHSMGLGTALGISRIGVLSDFIPAEKRERPDAGGPLLYQDSRMLFFDYAFSIIQTEYTNYLTGLKLQTSIRDYSSPKTENPMSDWDNQELIPIKTGVSYFAFMPFLGIQAFLFNRLYFNASIEAVYPYTDYQQGYSEWIGFDNYLKTSFGINVGLF